MHRNSPETSARSSATTCSTSPSKRSARASRHRKILLLPRLTRHSARRSPSPQSSPSLALFTPVPRSLIHAQRRSRVGFARCLRSRALARSLRVASNSGAYADRKQALVRVIVFSERSCVAPTSLSRRANSRSLAMTMEFILCWRGADGGAAGCDGDGAHGEPEGQELHEPQRVHSGIPVSLVATSCPQS